MLPINNSRSRRSLNSPKNPRPPYKAALSDAAKARDLIFCVGASETVAAEIAIAGPHWLEIFDAARTDNADSILAQMRCDLSGAGSRADTARELARFKQRNFFRISIADLTRHIDVNLTMLLMSRLADECVRAAFSAAVRLTGEGAHEAGDFCVLAMGKLGRERTQSQLRRRPGVHFRSGDTGHGSIAAARIGEIITELLSTGCFRIDMRLRPGGRNSPLAVPFDGALSFYQNFGQTWERAALLRARPVARIDFARTATAR